MRAQPWWWLTEEERAGLGLGRRAARTPVGVVFGAPDGLRLELAPRGALAVPLGPLSLSALGARDESHRRQVLARALALLGPRLDDGFDPAQAGLEGDQPVAIIDVPSVCERACVFCHVSLQPAGTRRPRGSDADVERALEATRGPVLFTGDDALSHPRVVEWVARAASKGLVPRLIGPPRKGLTAALAPLLARAGLTRWSTALLGDNAILHDEVAGQGGSYDAVLEATAAFRAAHVEVELVAPLIRPVLHALAAIDARARALSGRPLALLAFAPDGVVGAGFDGLVPRWDELRAALASAPALSPDSSPACVLPALATLHRLERTDPQVGATYPSEPCGRCDARPACPGVASTALRAVGSAGLVALRRSR